MRCCTRCKLSKSLDKFYQNRNYADGYHRWCKECFLEDGAFRDKQNPERRKEYKRRYNRKHREELRYKRIFKVYGMPRDEWERRKRDQNNCCKLCNSSERPLVVDHCHISGKVRGLICNRCNRALGLFGDNVEGVQNALKYLKDFLNDL